MSVARIQRWQMQMFCHVCIQSSTGIGIAVLIPFASFWFLLVPFGPFDPVWSSPLCETFPSWYRKSLQYQLQETARLLHVAKQSIASYPWWVVTWNCMASHFFSLMNILPPLSRMTAMFRGSAIAYQENCYESCWVDMKNDKQWQAMTGWPM